MGTSRLGNLLVEEGLLSEADRRTIRNATGHDGAAFARGLLALGLLDENDLVAFLADRTHHKVAPKNISEQMDENAIGLLDAPLLERLEVIPLKLQGDLLTVAMADPLDHETLRQVEFFTGCRVRPVIASFSQIRQLLAKLLPKYQPRRTNFESFMENHATAAFRKLKADTPAFDDGLSGQAPLSAHEEDFERPVAAASPKKVSGPQTRAGASAATELASSSRDDNTDELTQEQPVGAAPAADDTLDDLSTQGGDLEEIEAQELSSVDLNEELEVGDQNDLSDGLSSDLDAKDGSEISDDGLEDLSAELQDDFGDSPTPAKSVAPVQMESISDEDLHTELAPSEEVTGLDAEDVGGLDDDLLLAPEDPPIEAPSATLEESVVTPEDDDLGELTDVLPDESLASNDLELDGDHELAAAAPDSPAEDEDTAAINAAAAINSSLFAVSMAGSADEAAAKAIPALEEAGVGPGVAILVDGSGKALWSLSWPGGKAASVAQCALFLNQSTPTTNRLPSGSWALLNTIWRGTDIGKAFPASDAAKTMIGTAIDIGSAGNGRKLLIGVSVAQASATNAGLQGAVLDLLRLVGGKWASPR